MKIPAIATCIILGACSTLLPAKISDNQERGETLAIIPSHTPPPIATPVRPVSGICRGLDTGDVNETIRLKLECIEKVVNNDF